MQRRDLVLGNMYRQDRITKEEYEEAVASDVADQLDMSPFHPVACMPKTVSSISATTFNAWSGLIQRLGRA